VELDGLKRKKEQYKPAVIPCWYIEETATGRILGENIDEQTVRQWAKAIGGVTEVKTGPLEETRTRMRAQTNHRTDTT
jgi:hypothetical protein